MLCYSSKSLNNILRYYSYSNFLIIFSFTLSLVCAMEDIENDILRLPWIEYVNIFCTIIVVVLYSPRRASYSDQKYSE